MSSAVVGCSSPFLGVCGSLYSVAVAGSSSTVRGGLASSAPLRPSALSPVRPPVRPSNIDTDIHPSLYPHVAYYSDTLFGKENAQKKRINHLVDALLERKMLKKTRQPFS